MKSVLYGFHPVTHWGVSNNRIVGKLIKCTFDLLYRCWFLSAEHQFVHTEERPHKCSLCHKRFKQRPVLNLHTKTVHSTARTRDFKCSICPKRYYSNGNLTQHLRIHNQTGGSFSCYFCKKWFARWSALVIHTRTHTLKKPLPCLVDACKYSTSNPSCLNRHMKKHYPVKGQLQVKTCTCYFCSKTVTSLPSLANHLRLHTLEEPFRCGLCRKRFKTLTSLKRHISSHTLEKPYKCKQCLYRSFSSSDVKKHIHAVHRHVKRFYCKLCDYSTYHRSHYDKHALVEEHIWKS